MGSRFREPPRAWPHFSDFLPQRVIERPLIGLAVYAGLRQGEILALRWSDIDWANNRIHVRRNLESIHKLRTAGTEGVFGQPKTESGRRAVPIRAVLRGGLLEKRRRLVPPGVSDLVFASRVDEPLDAWNMVQRVYEPAVKHAGLRKIRFHDLRHSFVTYCAAAGVRSRRWVTGLATRTVESPRSTGTRPLTPKSSRSACLTVSTLGPGHTRLLE